jgi:hypothetical protein
VEWGPSGYLFRFGRRRAMNPEVFWYNDRIISLFEKLDV